MTLPNFEHGDFRIWIEGCVVYVQADNAFNEEGVSQVYDQIDDQVKQADLKQWICFIQTGPNTGGTPEAYAMNQARQEGLSQGGCVASFFYAENRIVLHGVSMRATQVPVVSDCYTELEQKLKVAKAGLQECQPLGS